MYTHGRDRALEVLGVKVASTALRRALKFVKSTYQDEYSYRLPSGRPLAVINTRSMGPGKGPAVNRSDNFSGIPGLGRKLYGDLARLTGELHSDGRVSAPAAKTWMRLGAQEPFTLKENLTAPVRTGYGELNYGSGGAPAFSLRSSLAPQEPRNMITTQHHPPDVMDLRRPSFGGVDSAREHNLRADQRWSDVLSDAGQPPAPLRLSDVMESLARDPDAPLARSVGRTRPSLEAHSAGSVRRARIEELRKALAARRESK